MATVERTGVGAAAGHRPSLPAQLDNPDGLPSAFEPERGYIASANERVAPDDYPYPLHGSWASRYRAARIHQVFAGAYTVDRDTVVGLQSDVKNVRAERLCPRLLEWLIASSDPDVDLLRQV